MAPSDSLGSGAAPQGITPPEHLCPGTQLWPEAAAGSTLRRPVPLPGTAARPPPPPQDFGDWSEYQAQGPWGLGGGGGLFIFAAEHSGSPGRPHSPIQAEPHPPTPPSRKSTQMSPSPGSQEELTRALLSPPRQVQREEDSGLRARRPWFKFWLNTPESGSLHTPGCPLSPFLWGEVCVWRGRGDPSTWKEAWRELGTC